MTEPDDLTAWVDRHGDTWVRVDEVADWSGPWLCLCDGPVWDSPGHPGGGWDWEEMAEYGPFTQADPQKTAAAVDLARRLGRVL